jgi:hypothetical protein
MFTRGLDSWVGVCCPRCSRYLGKTLVYRKGLTHIVGCAECKSTYRITYDKSDKLVGWTEQGEHLGFNNGISFVEYPYENSP